MARVSSSGWADITTTLPQVRANGAMSLRSRSHAAGAVIFGARPAGPIVTWPNWTITKTRGLPAGLVDRGASRATGHD